MKRRLCLLLVLWIAHGEIAAATPEASTLKKSAAIPAHSFLNNFTGMSLADQDNKVFEPEQYVGRVLLFNFVFTHCTSVCPTQTKDLAQVQKSLPETIRDQVHFISVSIDPNNDTPKKMKQFATHFQVDFAHWSFLTGSPEQLSKLMARLNIFDPSETGQNTKPQIHRTSLWLVDKQGRMLQRYKGDPVDKERLVRELEQISHLTVSHRSPINSFRLTPEPNKLLDDRSSSACVNWRSSQCLWLS